MSGRTEAARAVGELHSARMAGDLAAMCSLFTATELVDVVEVRGGLILGYSDFFVPRTGHGDANRARGAT